MPLELLERPAFECLDYVRIRWIRKHDISAGMEHLSLLKVANLDFTPYVLRALSPLELNALHTKLLDGIFMCRQAGVLDVRLKDDGSVSIALVTLVELHSALEIHRVNDSPVFDYCLRIHPDDVFADCQGGTSQSRSDGEPLPVILGNGC